ncbi:MAG: ATP-binding protein [Gemmatimonadetes bacterium]|nr:ATP-binding protein [Gemmatimonadota bacterium]
MTQADPRDRQVAILRDRLSRLSKASLRINESLDLDIVLQEVVASARSLTGARYGGIVTLDESGQFQDFITSGLTEEERQGLLALPGGQKLFELFITNPAPLRLRDFSGYARSLGVTGDLMQVRTFLGTPICHRGTHVGTFYLVEKEDGREFTAEDEETLGMFAAQAALALANARQHRNEQRARADLEALIDTSPVGVVVFDAKLGQLVSLNREASRIFGDLLMPGRSLGQLLEVLTFRRADGREISLEELPLTQALSTGETVRAEEVVVQVPDGRSVTTLLNATPIYAGEGEIESFVVTVQDMTPQEELARLRAEFLGMVSHELRVPLTSIKGAITTLLASSTALDPVEMRQFYRIIDHQAERMRDLISDLVDVAQIETGSLSVTLEPTDVASLVDEARNTFLSGGGRTTIEMDLPPDLPWIMADRRRIVQVLSNLLSNAASYSEASSAIRLTAVREDFYVGISIADEGRGIPADLLPHLFRKFSPVDSEDGERETHGTGLGLAICKGIVEAHGGRIWADSDGPGLGTTFTFTVPVAEESPSVSVPQTARQTKPSRAPQGPGESILVVDDDPHTLKYVRDALANAGYTPIVTADPGEVPPLIRSSKPQLVLLDVVLPGTDGIKLMEDILEVDKVPVILLSGYGRDEIIARAFERGASDYVVKPFSPTELIARIQATLRKETDPDRAAPDQPYVLGDLTINYEERRVTVAGRRVQLTAKEYQLLYELSVGRGRVLTHDVLLRRIWGLYSAVDSRLVRTLVKRLRRTLGDAANNPRYIFTEPGVGYRIGTAEEQEEESSEA